MAPKPITDYSWTELYAHAFYSVGQGGSEVDGHITVVTTANDTLIKELFEEWVDEYGIDSMCEFSMFLRGKGFATLESRTGIRLEK
jgi:hypothetical protein